MCIYIYVCIIYVCIYRIELPQFLTFYARIKTKTVLESLEDFLQTYYEFFKFSFSFSIDMRFQMGD